MSKSFKQLREYVRGFGTYPGDTMKPMASLGGAQFFPNRRYATTMPAMSAAYKGAGHGTIKPMVTADTKRIPRKPGQKAKSDKHSDLYTDEDPRGTIHGLGFKDAETAKKGIAIINKAKRTHAHKVQATLVMQQRAKQAIKTTKDPEKKANLRDAFKIWTDHLEKLKQKTKEMNK